MISFKRMDELLWWNNLEDVLNWTKRLQKVIEMWEYDEDKLFKIVRLNMYGQGLVY
jgi:hypothetical protein